MRKRTFHIALLLGVLLGGCAKLPAHLSYIEVRPVADAPRYVGFNDTEYEAAPALGFLRQASEKTGTEMTTTRVSDEWVGVILDAIDEKWVEKYQTPYGERNVRYSERTFQVLGLTS